MTGAAAIAAPILVVDDDQVLRSLMCASIEQCGFPVIEAADGHEACLRCDEVVPRLIVVDVVMPGMDGFALCTELRRRPATAHVPILMATGLDDTESITRAYEAGATDFITKPLNFIVLGHRIRYLLRANAAFEEVRRARAEMKTANELLEQRVEERTRDLRATQAELLRGERFSTIGQVTATIAHELRNPLGAISNTVFVVRTAVENNVVLGRAADRMDRSINRCNKIINNLLEFTTDGGLKLGDLKVDAWLDAIVDEAKIDATIDVQRDFDAGPIAIDADGDRLRRAVHNLIENAVLAIEEQGASGERRLIVSTHCVDDLEICIADTGCGIAPDVLPHVFEPLFSTRGFGAGLGLATAKRIVEQHGGSIAITSEVGKGTVVRLMFPLAAAQTAAA